MMLDHLSELKAFLTSSSTSKQCLCSACALCQRPINFRIASSVESPLRKPNYVGAKSLTAKAQNQATNLPICRPIASLITEIHNITYRVCCWRSKFANNNSYNICFRKMGPSGWRGIIRLKITSGINVTSSRFQDSDKQPVHDRRNLIFIQQNRHGRPLDHLLYQLVRSYNAQYPLCTVVHLSTGS